MATESLIVELDAKTQKLDSKLRATEKRLDKLDGTVKKTDVSFTKMGSAALLAATAASTAIAVLVKTTVDFSRELQIAANRANTTVEEMQALAFASGTVGISLEKLGDISKDTNEKIAEFIATGGGGFVDFIDVMKLSSKEANVLAREFQNMSGPEVLQEMTNQMEAAGISGGQMSFALEGLASDTTDLIPLLKDGGAELKRLKDNFNELNITLSQNDLDKIKDVGEAFNKLSEVFSAEGRQFIADYGDQLIAVAEAIGTLSQVSSDIFGVIVNGWGNIIELGGAALNDFINGTETFAGVLKERTALSVKAMDELVGNNAKALEITITVGTKLIKSTTREEKASLDQRLKNFSNYSKAAAVVNSAFLEDNKAIKAGLIVADTAAAVMMQMSSGDPYTAFGRAALAAAMGAAQLSNALSSTKGGGSVSEGGGGSVTSTEQPSFERETSSLEVTAATEGGSSQGQLVLATDTGDDLINAIAEALNKGISQGTITL